MSLLNFMSKLLPVLDATTSAISLHLDRDFEGDEKYVPAALIFNPLVSDHAVWTDLGKEYGRSKTKEAVEDLRRFDKWLQNRDFADLTDRRRRIINYGIKTYSGPLYPFIIDPRSSLKTPQIRASVQFLLEHLECCLSSETNYGGNFRAYRTAVALRVIFETYSDIPVTVGDNYGHPSGPFCKCLEEIFEIGGIDGGFRHYANRAKETPSSDTMLVDMKRQLIEVPLNVTLKTSEFY